MTKLTVEQAKIATYQGRQLVVKAYAGSGKTFTLIQYARNNPAESILYLAYNRGIRDDAQGKLPPNVDCKTSHQLAFQVFGRRLASMLVSNLRLRDIATAALTTNWTLARDIQATLNAFMNSDSPSVCAEHFTRLDDNAAQSSKVARYQHTVVDSAVQLWERMIDADDQFPATHDTYLKLYQLSDPNLSERYQTILFDEAQDANPVTSSIVLKQRCRQIFVGDEHQQIYRFRGANSAMRHPSLAHTDHLYLTHSFRFGKTVAFVANALLELKGETRPVIGRGDDDEVVSSPMLVLGQRHTALISRTVMGGISDAIYCAAQGLKTYWVGGIEGYNVALLLDAYHLANGNTQEIINQRLKSEYKDYGDYCHIAEATRDPEMLRTIKILDSYGDIPRCLDLLRSFATRDELEAVVSVTTAHRCKGLEWDDVRLGDDYPNFLGSDMDGEQISDEINLLYVSATRAMKRLYISGHVESVLYHVAQLRRDKQARALTLAENTTVATV